MMEEDQYTNQWSVINFTKYQLRIIKATLLVFSKRGILNTTAEEIAQMAGIRKSTIFYHFKSMEKLYDNIFKYLQNRMRFEMFSDVGLQKGTENTLKYLWMKRASWGIENPDAMRFIFTMYALEENDRIEIDRPLLRIIHNGIISSQLTNYNNTHIACMFYAGNNSIILSLIGKRYYYKKEITIIKKSFESFYETVRFKKKLEDYEDFYWK